MEYLTGITHKAQGSKYESKIKIEMKLKKKNPRRILVKVMKNMSTERLSI